MAYRHFHITFFFNILRATEKLLQQQQHVVNAVFRKYFQGRSTSTINHNTLNNHVTRIYATKIKLQIRVIRSMTVTPLMKQIMVRKYKGNKKQELPKAKNSNK